MRQSSSWLLTALFASTAQIILAGDARAQTTFAAVPAPEWSSLFDRSSGWTGADGIYTIPINGVDAIGSATSGSRTLFLFSDTFIGDVNAQGQRMAGTTIVNNTMALLHGNQPDPSKIRFYYPIVNGDPAAVLIPDTPDTQPGDWYWLQDGIAVNGKVHVFTLRMKTGGGGVFNFAVAGVAYASKSLAEPRAKWIQNDAPLFLPANDARGDLIFGTAFMPNTAEAGAPEPDGFIYIYGTQNDLSKKLIAARVTPGQFEDFAAWRYWNGSDWGADINACAPITNRVSSELSVTPIGGGKYMAVFQLDGLSDNVAVRIGDTPVGPFGPARIIWYCPESEITPNTYIYNAKAHPHLSAPGELLISYNVNTFEFVEHFQIADIYRPRFIRLPLN